MESNSSWSSVSRCWSGSRIITKILVPLWKLSPINLRKGRSLFAGLVGLEVSVFFFVLMALNFFEANYFTLWSKRTVGKVLIFFKTFFKPDNTHNLF